MGGQTFLWNACEEDQNSYETKKHGDFMGALVKVLQELGTDEDITVQELYRRVNARLPKKNGRRQTLSWNALGTASRDDMVRATFKRITAFAYIGLHEYEAAPLDGVKAFAEEVITTFLRFFSPYCTLVVLMKDPPKIKGEGGVERFDVNLEPTYEKVRGISRAYMNKANVCMITEGHGLKMISKDPKEASGHEVSLLLPGGQLVLDDLWEEGIAARTDGPEDGQAVGLYINDFCHCGGTFNPRVMKVSAKNFVPPALPLADRVKDIRHRACEIGSNIGSKIKNQVMDRGGDLVKRSAAGVFQFDYRSIITAASAHLIPAVFMQHLRSALELGVWATVLQWLPWTILALLVLPVALAALSVVGSGGVISALAVGAPMLIAMWGSYLHDGGQLPGFFSDAFKAHQGLCVVGGAAAAGLITLVTFVALIRTNVRKARLTRSVATTMSFLSSLCTVYKSGFNLHLSGKGSLFRQSVTVATSATEMYTVHYVPMSNATPKERIGFNLTFDTTQICKWNISSTSKVIIDPKDEPVYSEAQFTVTCDYPTFVGLTAKLVEKGPDKKDPMRNVHTWRIGNVSVDKLFLEQNVDALLQAMQMVPIGTANVSALEAEIEVIKRQRLEAGRAPEDNEFGHMVWDTQFDQMAFVGQRILDSVVELLRYVVEALKFVRPLVGAEA